MNKKNKRINYVKDFEKFLVNENIYNDEILTEGAIGPYIGRAINAGKSKLPALASKYASARNAVIHAAQHPIETLKKSPDFIANIFSRRELDPVKYKRIKDSIEKLENIIYDNMPQNFRSLPKNQQMDMLRRIKNSTGGTPKEIAVRRAMLNIDRYNQLTPLIRQSTVGRSAKNFLKHLTTVQNPNVNIKQIEDDIIKYSRILSSGLENGKPITKFRRSEITNLINTSKDDLMALGKNISTPGRKFSPGRVIKSGAGVGAVAGISAAGSEKNEDINAIKKGLNPWAFKRGIVGTGMDTISTLFWFAATPITASYKITLKTLNALNIVKTPDEFPKLFEQLSNAPKEVRDKIVPKLSWDIRAKYFIYEKSKRAKNLVTNAANMPTAAKVGLGAAGLAGGALVANEIRKQIALNKAKVYGCDTIEDPTKKLQCEIMVAKENIKEYKKFLSKCYDSNNPESCVKIYSQKVKDEEAKLANLTNQFNSQNKPKSIATTQPSENKPKKSKKTKSKSKPKKSEEPKRLN